VEEQMFKDSDRSLVICHIACCLSKNDSKNKNNKKKYPLEKEEQK